MTFEQQLLVTILDKGLLAILLAVLVWLGNVFLQRRKARTDLAVALAEKRADAYVALWNATEDLRSTDPPPLDSEKRKELVGALTRLYFDDGVAMYLSHAASAKFLEAKMLLVDGGVSDDAVRNTYSALRTQMKVDLQIYSQADASKPLREQSK